MAESFDEKAAQALQDSADVLLKVIQDATESTKRVRAQRICQKCGCKHIEMVEIPNYEAALKAAEFLANRGFGRPNQKQDEEDTEKIVVLRNVYYSGPPDKAA